MTNLSRRSLLGGVAAGGAVAVAGPAHRAGAARPAGHVVLLALDGFDHAYLDGRVPMPNLWALARRGTLTRGTGVMATFTNPSWTSVSCGTWPDVTQNAAYWWDEAAGVARGQSRDSAVEGLGQSLRRQGKTIGSAQWFIMQDKGVSYGDPGGLYTQPGGRIDARVDDAIAMITGAPVRSGGTTVRLPAPPDFLAVYSSDIDGDGHSYGPNSPEIRSALAETDRAIGRLVQAFKDADLFGRTTWIVTADHGMSEWRIPQGPQALASLAAAGFRAEIVGSGGRLRSTDTQVVLVSGGSTSVHLRSGLQGDPAAVAGVRSALLGVEGVTAALDKGDQGELRMAPQYGELVIETAEPYSLFLTPPADGADGRHGGRDELDVPFLLAGHRVRPNSAPRAPRHVDVAPTISTLLGVDPPAASGGRVLAESLFDR